MPSRIPRSLTHQKSSRSRTKKLCTIANKNIGQNSSFICSHVDSFTPENGAIHTASPSQSYKKCNSVPPSTVTANPKNCQTPTERFIFLPPRKNKYCSDKVYSEFVRIILCAVNIPRISRNAQQDIKILKYRSFAVEELLVPRFLTIEKFKEKGRRKNGDNLIESIDSNANN